MAISGLRDTRFPFEKGLIDIGNGAYAWLQPDGGWGWSNAGLLVDGQESLLIDTLFDVPLTQTMLDGMRDAEPRATRAIDTLVNTHANGDHCHGNELVKGAEIIASTTAAQEMDAVPPEVLAAMMRQAREGDDDVAKFLVDCFGDFEFEGIQHTTPTRTFDENLQVTVGDLRVELTEVGPAHTGGDILVHVPDLGVVYTGDILFVEGTPILWAGPVQNWIDACQRILEMEAAVIVPGHGPIATRRAVEAVSEYLVYVRDEARQRYDAGLDAWEAAQDIALADYSSWGDAERIAINVDTLYREFSGSSELTDRAELFRRMAVIARSR